MKAFLVALREVVKKDYPDINFEFYLSQRSNLYIWDSICR